MERRVRIRLVMAWMTAAAVSAAPARAAEPPTSPDEEDTSGGAQGTLPDGTIVQIDKDTIYIDIGTARAQGRTGVLRGLGAGATLEVLRTISARHPITGEQLVDYFPLGTMSVTEVGRVLSQGRIERRLVGVVKVGDVVKMGGVVRVPQRGASAAATEPVTTRPARSGGTAATPAAPAPTVEDEATREAVAVWRGTLGKPIEDRIAILDGYLRARPASPLAAALRGEIDTLRGVAESLRATRLRAVEDVMDPYARSATRSAHTKGRAQTSIATALPERLYRGDPLDLAVLVRDGAEVAAVFAYVRAAGAATARRVTLLPDGANGDGYFRAPVPADALAPPHVDVFIEAVDHDSRVVATLVPAEEPRRILIEELPGGPPSPGPGHSAVRGYFEFVDFNRYRGNDYYLHTEADFMYRIGGTLHAVRTGFGVLYGRGGLVAKLDRGTPEEQKGVEVGFNYGYVEGELRFGRYVGMSARLLGGQTVKGDGIGAELRLRIGQETGTNLVLGGSIYKDIGALALLQLEWDVINGWPMSASVVVTDQPAQGDLGVRIIYQIAYRARSWFQPALRIGYDVRNIDHSGLSLGLGLIMGW